MVLLDGSNHCMGADRYYLASLHWHVLVMLFYAVTGVKKNKKLTRKVNARSVFLFMFSLPALINAYSVNLLFIK